MDKMDIGYLYGKTDHGYIPAREICVGDLPTFSPCDVFAVDGRTRGLCQTYRPFVHVGKVVPPSSSSSRTLFYPEKTWGMWSRRLRYPRERNRRLENGMNGFGGQVPAWAGKRCWYGDWHRGLASRIGIEDWHWI